MDNMIADHRHLVIINKSIDKKGILINHLLIANKKVTMKRSIALVTSLFFTVIVIAQNETPPKPPSAEERLKHFTERLDKEMNLSGEQKQRVLVTYKEFFAKMDQLHAKYPPPPPPPPPPAEMKEQMDKLVAEKDSKLQGVLSEEQFRKLKQLDEMHHKGRGMPPPPPPAKL